ncbi:hypothetical protein GCM10009630_16460 [Kribbella jejuensis]|uniref:Nucleic acid/nucleotide deaminase of polymorphic system toxin n=1 Tax=Kribbella jejuensis TaxID=236068 RepID=A0A542EB53_9ACTN|nr:hypothetical protein [Kribbella jejuensis]TQJ12578.1 hypothetical protein FB475_5526 [Kribbella jejuensis]
MPRRPLAAAATTLSTLLLLTACNGSPEAGRPNTAPPSTSTTPSPTPSAPSTPTWTPEQQAAITAAKSRYAVATAAIDRTFTNPSALDRPALEKAGLSGQRIITIVDQARTLVRNGLYLTGNVQIAKTTVVSVKLKQAQPEVVLLNCLDSSKQVMRFKSNGKPVPSGPGSATRRQVTSHLRFALGADNKKLWFLISDEDKGPC